MTLSDIGAAVEASDESVFSRTLTSKDLEGFEEVNSIMLGDEFQVCNLDFEL